MTSMNRLILLLSCSASTRIRKPADLPFHLLHSDPASYPYPTAALTPDPNLQHLSSPAEYIRPEYRTDGTIGFQIKVVDSMNGVGDQVGAGMDRGENPLPLVNNTARSA